MGGEWVSYDEMHTKCLDVLFSTVFLMPRAPLVVLFVSYSATLLLRFGGGTRAPKHVRIKSAGPQGGYHFLGLLCGFELYGKAYRELYKPNQKANPSQVVENGSGSLFAIYYLSTYMWEPP